MSKDKQRLIDYLAHMRQAIERITRYIDELDDQRRRPWILRG